MAPPAVDSPSPARMRWGVAIALSWFGVNLVLTVVVTWLFVLSRADGLHLDSPADALASLFVVVFGSALGAAVAARFPRLAIGWLFLGLFSVYLADGLLVFYAGLADHRAGWPGAAVAAGFEGSVQYPMFGLVAAALLLFPDGRLPPGRRWTWLLRAIVLVFPLTYLVQTFAAHETLRETLAGRANPLVPDGLADHGGRIVGGSLVALCAALLLGSLLSVRFRVRHGDRVQRQQLKWMALAGLTLPAGLLLCGLVRIFDKDIASTAVAWTFNAMLFSITAAAALAVNRYRLYSVDRLVDTALVHLALTALLVAGYAAVVIGSSHLFSGGETLSPAAVAGGTLAVALVAAPLRRRLQTVVNRRLHRRSYDAGRIVDRFVEELLDERASLDELESVLRRATDDPTLRLGLWLPGVDRYVRPNGAALLAGDPARSRFEVSRNGAPVAVLVHDARLAEQPGLLDTVTRAAALPIDNTRLQVEVLARLAEVRASRQRIVSAAYEERRRIERDLHDGAQQRLVSIALSLRLALGHVDASTALLLDEIAGQLQAAIREVRELARGIHPQSLLDDGLVAALESMADRTPFPVLVDVPDLHFPDDIATAAYFVACEAVTNAVKHADASCVTVRGRLERGRLSITIEDDGAGGASIRAHGGLEGVADRVHAVGGEFGLLSECGSGTTVRMELPCAL